MKRILLLSLCCAQVYGQTFSEPLNYVGRTSDEGAYNPSPSNVLPRSHKRAPILTAQDLGVNDTPIEDYPLAMEETDFFGKASPKVGFYDPLNSGLTQEGKAVEIGQVPSTEVDVSYVHSVNSGSMPQVVIVPDNATRLVLLKNGKAVFPKRVIPASKEMYQVITSPDSPYIYLMANDIAYDPNRPVYSNLFIEADLGDRILTYQMRLVVRSPNHPDFREIRAFDLIDDHSPGFFDENGNKLATPSSSIKNMIGAWDSMPISTPTVAQIPESMPSSLSETSEPWWDGMAQRDNDLNLRNQSAMVKDFTDEEIAKYFPAMIGQALDYEKAISVQAEGYEPENIQKFRPTTINRGRILEGKMPVFRNPVDGQRYYLNYAYFFPTKDAVLYELVMKNESLNNVGFDYDYIRLVRGSGSLQDSVSPTAVSPDYQITPPGVRNSIWILVQGQQWLPVDPVKVIFPERTSNSAPVSSLNSTAGYSPRILYNDSGDYN
jgi:hypothetical protein